MTKQEFYHEKLGERYTVATHKTGLKILLCPKPSYSSIYALFGTRYGSIDTRFKRADEPDFLDVPEGIAHFLEHKLFESEDGDAFSRYAKTGASANAYTSFDLTCYLFSCSDKFKESFDILLDFVQSPYFTEQTVQKEQGIIGQEIRMNEDNASWRVFFNLLRALYKEHPVRIDIAGTVESIAKIDDQMLYRCYSTFYNLNNMFICVVGNMQIDEVLEQINARLRDLPPVDIERGRFSEPPEVVQPYIEQNLEVSLPLFAFGFKEICEKPQKTLEEKITAELLLEIIAGDASPLYSSLFEDGLINDTFGCDYFTGQGYAAAIFQGESADPQAVKKRILAEIADLSQNSISKKAFENARKKLYGRRIMQYNAVESVAQMLTQSALTGNGLFDELTVFEAVTPKQVEDRLKGLFNEKASALSVVLPVHKV